MNKRYEFFVGLRYLRSRGDNRFLSFISIISMVGIGLSVAVLITVLSVMNGFEKELRERILSMTAHATIFDKSPGLPNWQTMVATAGEHPQVAHAAPYIEGQGMFVNGTEISGALIRGIVPDQEANVAGVERHMTIGELTDLRAGDYSIVLGQDLAEALGVGLGDKIILVLAQGYVTPAGIIPRMKRFTVSGMFRAGMYEYDRNLAFVNMTDAATLFRMGNNVTGVRLSLHDMYAAPWVVREVAGAMNVSGYVSSWTNTHRNFFRAIQITKNMMFIILSMMVAVAAFNIVSTLVMVVNDKREDIAIFRTMGSTPKSLLGVFMIQGTMIGFFGTLSGLVLGVLLATNVELIVNFVESLLGIEFLDSAVYFISDLPSVVKTADVLLICSTAFSLSVLATIYPSLRAARTLPAEALRHD